MKVNLASLHDKAGWAAAGVTLPGYDVAAMRQRTKEHPVWVHFGAGNIFRAFIAVLQQRLLDRGLADRGIIAADTFDVDNIRLIYGGYDNLTLSVVLKADGTTDREIVGSVAEALVAQPAQAAEWARLKDIFRDPGLQMISFTITEKGYALRGMDGAYTPVAAGDIAGGPEQARHAMGIVTALLLERFRAGAAPLAVVSMDNCSHNGEKLRGAILDIAGAWVKAGFAGEDFLAWLQDEEKVSFPWSMIDKITPRPAKSVEESLTAAGIEGMGPVVTPRGTFLAPFVNAERPQYLVVEDRFPNGRPPLEEAGVYFTDRDTVNRVERMKVTTCLNPLHTALAVYGCLLGYDLIANEMKDPDLVRLVKRIGYTEGLPVVTDPGILSPKAFIDEVIGERLPNVFMPDTPQRIATDTSQKVPIRFGETIKSYMADPERNPADLTGIPLALAGWLRYLLGVDDRGNPMVVSDDPMLAELQGALAGVTLGDPDSVVGKLRPILSNPVLFGVDLYAAGLAGKVEALLREELAGPGAVRITLKKHLNPRPYGGNDPIRIAIDGPVGAGKSTIADAVARALGILHLDTGAMYRAAGLTCLERGVDIGDEEAAVALCRSLDLDVRHEADGQHTLADGRDLTGGLRTEAVGLAASTLGTYMDVRRAMVAAQQRIARTASMLVDGRDIGTTVLPDADVKIFLTAAPEERARRRWLDLQAKGDPTPYEQVLSDLKDRDYQDTHRAADPLRQAEDAIVVDTTRLTFEESVAEILRIVKEVTGVG
ncbi:MAG: (d)CMP kinase [Clostridia bacterium]|nr:(d)CMP kinase [Clostridia bacterium]